MKKLLYLLVILSVSISSAQDIKLSLGYKSIELGGSKTIENGLILGGTISLTDSQQIAKRANQFCQIHKIYTKNIPTAFILFGANFNKFNMIGKIGSCYIDKQDVTTTNGLTSITEPYNHKFFLAVGVNLMYMVSDTIGISGSYDNVNAAMIGINYKL